METYHEDAADASTNQKKPDRWKQAVVWAAVLSGVLALCALVLTIVMSWLPGVSPETFVLILGALVAGEVALLTAIWSVLRRRR